MLIEGDGADTNRTVSFVYNANVDLECSTSGTFYATKDGVTTQVTQTETSDKYKINGNVLTIQSLSSLHLIHNLNDRIILIIFLNSRKRPNPKLLHLQFHRRPDHVHKPRFEKQYLISHSIPAYLYHIIRTFLFYLVQPYLYQIETLLVVEIEEYPGELVCHILVGNETGQNIRWSWFKAASPVSTDDDRISYNATSNNTVSALKWTKLQASDSAIYTCTATNDYGSFTRSIELRVKSKYF